MRRWIRGDMLVVLAVLAAAALFFVLRPSQGAAAARVSVGDSLCRRNPSDAGAGRAAHLHRRGRDLHRGGAAGAHPHG